MALDPSSRAAPSLASVASGGREQKNMPNAGDAIEPFWLPWHIDPNTISTLTGDSYFHFDTAQTVNVDYPDEGLGLLAMNSCAPWLLPTSLQAAQPRVLTRHLPAACLPLAADSRPPGRASC